MDYTLEALKEQVAFLERMGFKTFGGVCAFGFAPHVRYIQEMKSQEQNWK